MIKIKPKKLWKPGVIFAYTIVSLVLTIVFNLSVLDFFASVTAVLYIFLLSERHIFNFLVGFVNVALYILVAFFSQLYGEAIFYLVIDIPFAIISYFYWRKRASADNTVDSRSLKLYWYPILLIGGTALAFGYSFFLQFIGGVNNFVDALSTVATLIATLLMLFCFKEQWFMWIVVYVISIVLWSVTDNILMIIMSAACLINSVYGFVIWHLNSKSLEPKSAKASSKIFMKAFTAKSSYKTFKDNGLV